jgi:vacuolar-type H+-ATPase subunit F/Vma7
MPEPIYLGDEVSAAGWRLAGLHVTVIEPGIEAAALAAAREQAPLVLIAASVAARIAAEQLHTALVALSPLTLVVPDQLGTPARDVGAKLRGQLGL